MDYSLNLGRERAAQQLILCRQKDGRIQLKGDVGWIPNKELPILDMPLKIPNKLKTEAKVFDVFFKENGVKFGNIILCFWAYPPKNVYSGQNA